MFEVIVIVCLAASGAQCEEFKLPEKQYDSIMSCIRESHAEAATWQRDNEKFTIMGTRCAKDSKIPVAPKS